MKRQKPLIIPILILLLLVPIISFTAFAREEAEPYNRVASLVAEQEYGIAIQKDDDSWYVISLSDDNAPETSSAETLTDYMIWQVKSDMGRTRLVADSFELTVDPDSCELICTEYQAQEPRPEGPAPESGDPQPESLEGMRKSGWKYDYSEKFLTYTKNNIKYYITLRSIDEEAPYIACTADESEAAQVILCTFGEGDDELITVQPEAQPYYIMGSPRSMAPTYSIRTVNGGYTDFSYTWYINDEPAETDAPEITLDAYRTFSEGVYDIYCKVSCLDDSGTRFTDCSAHVNYIVCRGIMPKAFLTFSDVHESFTNIGRAIEEVLQDYDGLIPGLIVCTGDWSNEMPSTDQATTAGINIPALRGQSGGIRTIYVSGNHDNGTAAEEANRQENFSYNGLRIFPVHYDDIVLKDENGKKYYSYEQVLPRLEAFLKSLKYNYNNELILISAHAGLHVLGIQPESSASEFSGGNSYNVDGSAEMVRLINKYAEEYHMDILYMFGHDHSKNEKEFFLTRGDTIYSTTQYADRAYEEQELHFSYMQAGYITGSINGTEHYSLVRWNRTEITRELRQLGGKTTVNWIEKLSRGSDSPIVRVQENEKNNEKKNDKEEEKEKEPEKLPETIEPEKKPEGSWVKDGNEWYYLTSEGSCASNGWKKIGGKWYYFNEEGIMEHNAYRNGYYLTSGGAWDEKMAVAVWKKNKTGWWYSLIDKEYLSNTWKKIDGSWYYFNEEGYAVRNRFISGWWIGDDFTQTDPVRCSWHKSPKGWWYGVKGGWYAKDDTYTIDEHEYQFDIYGYLIP